MDDLLQVGVITSTHGVKGEVKVFPTTDDPQRFQRLKEVILDTGKEQIILAISGVKYFKQFVILKFQGIDNINDVEKYRQKSLYVTRQNAVKLRRDEYFIADLVGLQVLADRIHLEEIGGFNTLEETCVSRADREIPSEDGRTGLGVHVTGGGTETDINEEDGAAESVIQAENCQAEQDVVIGILTDVLETGANDVYVINLNDGRELLLPAIKQCVLAVDVDAGWIKVHILEGLLD